MKDQFEPYTAANLPRSAQAAEARVRQLVANVRSIDRQLAEAKNILGDEHTPADTPEKVIKRQWKRRAIIAKACKEEEIKFLKTWLREEGKRMVIEVEEWISPHPVDSNNMTHLFLALYNIAHRYEQAGNLDGQSSIVLNAAGRYLGKC